MKNITLALAVSGALALSLANTANAANNGVLKFSGTLTNISCSVSPGTGTGPGTQPGDIAVDLGNVSFSDIGTSGENKLETATPIQLLVNCTAGADQYNLVKMRFKAGMGHGTDDNDSKLLRVTGSAGGVAIGVLNASNQLMDLSGTGTIDKPLVKDGAGGATAELNLAGVYMLNGTVTRPGTAMGDLPFTLDYE
ncbi:MULTISPECIES: fimbrial protein [Pseudomonas]|uniref:Type 1 fimbrial protein n=1 Tax=Pseudomonas phytophila TaxID=2867264 RepID=A0ABY6FJ20_9PSED|nr:MULTISPECIES: fimbrial protein [Pseudomonas]MCD5989483.1 type 1 fimbrial protein [Pseudomonas quasicaspiana]MDU8359439.1 fimbrial protein [Pseudomonas syringae group sp. J309-1]UXZ97653.1 type 1 fimbrial protein [Pseudomonas phytophila]